MTAAERLANTEQNIILWRGLQLSAGTPKEAEACARVVDASLEEWNTIRDLSGKS